MSNFTKGLGACLAAALMSTGAFADPVDDTLVINEEIDIVTRTAAPVSYTHLTLPTSDLV